MLFVATTTNHKVFSIDLRNDVVKLFVDRNTMDMANGAPVGAQFTNPDNLAIDADGNMYIVEDQPGGFQDTWFDKDDNNDGVAEAIGKWASLATVGAEGTGLYFDPFKPNTAYISVQHPDSGADRIMMITAPCHEMKDDDRHDEGRDKAK
jgi:secreted PhoX family phosphatase